MCIRDSLKNPYLFSHEVDSDGEDRFVIYLSEDVSFLNRAVIMRTLDNIPPESKVFIDASKSLNIDYDVYEILQNFHKKAALRDIEVNSTGLALWKRNDAVERAHEAIEEVSQKRQAI